MYECVLLNQLLFPLKAFFAKIWIVSSNGTLVKSTVTILHLIMVACHHQNIVFYIATVYSLNALQNLLLSEMKNKYLNLP